jgi:L-fuconolactonase
MKIDAHQHFWNYDSDRHSWINDSMHLIRKSFLPETLGCILLENGIDGCIAVQADQTIEETHFLIGLAQKNEWIKAVIGWVDLRSEDIETQLQSWKQFPILKGFRHILQAEEPDFMLSKEFIRGIECLQKFNYCYEILIYPKHLSAALSLVQQFPEMRFVIDHMAKPNIRAHQMEGWKEGMQILGKQKNVYCKISGLVTEADWEHWVPADFEPYLKTVVEAFGIEHLMYGSDWPVCLVAAAYDTQLNICKQYFKDFSEQENLMIFGANAARFYQL